MLRSFRTTYVLAVLAAAVPCRMAACAERLTLRVTTDPPVDQIRPNEAPARIVIRAAHADGAPVENARVVLALDLPPRNAFFSTGFPIAEGTPLLRATAIAPHGELEISTLFPIRGAYALSARVEQPGDPASASEMTFTIGVNEEPGVVRNFVLLIFMLAGFGLVSGIVLGRSSLKNAARGAAAIALLLLFHPLTARAHDDHAHPNPAAAPTTSHVAADSPSGDRIEMKLDREFATVGQMAGLKGWFAQKAESPAATEFTLSFINLDHDKEIFRMQFLSADGRFDLQHQFTDGADHRIVLSARPADAPGAVPVETEMTIAVHAIHPPAVIVYRTLAFLVGIAALAMAAGYFATVRLAKGRAA